MADNKRKRSPYKTYHDEPGAKAPKPRSTIATQMHRPTTSQGKTYYFLNGILHEVSNMCIIFSLNLTVPNNNFLALFVCNKE